MQNERGPSKPENSEFSGFLNGDYTTYSWVIHSDSIAEKKTDRSVFLHHGTGIPHQIRSFFGITDLKPGENKPIALWYQNNRYDAYLKMTTLDSPRSQMHWRSDFSTILDTNYPKWLNFFRAGGMESDDTPSLKFVKRSTPDEYNVEFIEGSSPQITPTVEISLKPGGTLNNEQLQLHFKCSPQGGMRRAHKTNSLVLISDHTKSFYVDTWVDDVFFYTGMGLTGNQSLTFAQNKTLAESKTNGVHLHLFEVFEEGKYLYIGEVELVETPHIAKQTDKNNNLRDVYIFPLKIKGLGHPPLLKKELIEKEEEIVRKKVHKLSFEELELRAKYSHNDGGKREVISAVYERNQLVSEYAKRRACGICQLCNQPAPFCNLDGEPYLETHHIDWLSKGGLDVIENTVALCPNCHKKMHVLNVPADVLTLKKEASPRT
jgi:5-methylcytosine-specific restriction protein A